MFFYENNCIWYLCISGNIKQWQQVSREILGSLFFIAYRHIQVTVQRGIQIGEKHTETTVYKPVK